MIRRCRPDDLPAITAIYAHNVATGSASFETETPDETEMRRRFSVLMEKQYPYFVAELGGEVCGYAYAGPYRTRPAYRHSVENSVYVADSAHRLGVGKALLRTLIQACREQGFRQMIAIIGDSANHASVQLHETVGFDMVGTIKDVGYKHDRWLDSVLMQLPLGDGASTPPD